MGVGGWGVAAIHPAPFTPHPTPFYLHPTPYTLHSTPYTLHPTPYTPHLDEGEELLAEAHGRLSFLFSLSLFLSLAPVRHLDEGEELLAEAHGRGRRADQRHVERVLLLGLCWQ